MFSDDDPLCDICRKRYAVDDFEDLDEAEAPDKTSTSFARVVASLTREGADENVNNDYYRIFKEDGNLLCDMCTTALVGQVEILPGISSAKELKQTKCDCVKPSSIVVGLRPVCSTCFGMGIKLVKRTPLEMLAQEAE